MTMSTTGQIVCPKCKKPYTIIGTCQSGCEIEEKVEEKKDD